MLYSLLLVPSLIKANDAQELAGKWSLGHHQNELHQQKEEK